MSTVNKKSLGGLPSDNKMPFQKYSPTTSSLYSILVFKRLRSMRYTRMNSKTKKTKNIRENTGSNTTNSTNSGITQIT
jgi:hypothetical protein